MNAPVFDELDSIARAIHARLTGDPRLWAVVDEGERMLYRLAAFDAREAGQKPPAEYACHCDLEPHMEPDGCVIDENKRGDCIYAKSIASKWECEYWQPKVSQQQP